MTREQWILVEPLFRNIRNSSHFAAVHAGLVLEEVEHLPVVPSWNTKAKSLIDTAEKQIAAALHLIREAQVMYDAKPVSADPVFLQAAE